MADATSDAGNDARVVCPAAKDAGMRIFIIAAMLIGVGIWCFADRKDYPAPKAWDAEHINEAAGHVFNNYGPFLFIPVGAACLLLGLRARRLVLVADDHGVGYVGKDAVPWSAVTGVVDTDLKEKQILCLKLGGDRTLKLDGYKLQNFKALVALVEEMAPSATADGESAGDTPGRRYND